MGSDSSQVKPVQPPGRVIALTGGKGGTGKTTLSVNIATMLAKSGKKVLLFDADLGLSNIDVLLGLQADKTIEDVLSGRCSLSEICIQGPHGLQVIPGGTGIQSLASLSTSESAGIIQSFATLTRQYDFMLVDLASGISSQVTDFTHASQNIVIVICNDPSSFSDSYAVIKVLHHRYSRKDFGIIVNRVRDDEEGMRTFIRFQDATSRFIHTSLNYLGALPQDDLISKAAHYHKPVVDCFPNTRSVRALREISRSILRWPSGNVMTGGVQYFFERMTGVHSRLKETAV